MSGFIHPACLPGPHVVQHTLFKKTKHLSHWNGGCMRTGVGLVVLTAVPQRLQAHLAPRWHRRNERTRAWRLCGGQSPAGLGLAPLPLWTMSHGWRLLPRPLLPCSLMPAVPGVTTLGTAGPPHLMGFLPRRLRGQRECPATDVTICSEASEQL